MTTGSTGRRADLLLPMSSTSEAIRLVRGEEIEKTIRAGQQCLKSSIAALGWKNGADGPEQAVLKLLALGEGKTGIFKIRRKELNANDYGRIILEETS